jgi:hypothetical protein
MKTIEETMIIIHHENNHRKMNMLEEIEIVKAASSKYLLNDVIAGQNDLMYRLFSSINDFKSNGQLPKPGDRRNFDAQQLEEFSHLNSNVHLPKPGDRRNFDTQQELQKMSTNWQKAYMNEHS